MFLTFFASTVAVATALITVMGFSWGIAIWAPYALISTEIAWLRQSPRTSTNSDRYWRLDVEDQWRVETDSTAAIMGIHNMAIAVPQIFAALTCAVVLKLTEVLGGQAGEAWVFRVAGCAALVAAWTARGFLR